MSFGGGSSSPSPPPAPAYTPAPDWVKPKPFIPANPANSAFEKYVPQVETGSQVIQGAPLGQGEAQALDSGWLNLSKSPTDPFNMNQAENDYLQKQGLPQLASDASSLNANGQGGSSYAGAYLGQETAMNNLNAWNAGLNQNNSEFQNALGARNALFSQPIALQQQQNQSNVNRGLGVSQLDLAQTLGQNQYNMQGTMGENQYNLGTNGIQNNFNQGIYGTKGSMYGSQLSANASMHNSNNSLMGSLIGGGLGLAGSLGSAYIGNLS